MGPTNPSLCLHDALLGALPTRGGKAFADEVAPAFSLDMDRATALLEAPVQPRSACRAALSVETKDREHGPSLHEIATIPLRL